MKWFSHSGSSSLLMRYSHLLASHPYGVLLSVAGVFIFIISLPFITHKFPDFSDPQLGFESRRTEISSRLAAWDNLVEATRTSGPLTFNPSELYHFQEKSYKIHFSDGKKSVISKASRKKNRRMHLNEANKTSGTFSGSGRIALPLVTEDYAEEDDDDMENDAVDPILGRGNSSNSGDFEEFFCGEPSPDYARVVLSSTSGESMLTYDAMLAMCRLEHEILIGSGEASEVTETYKSLCQPSKSGACCTPWSLPNYVAQLTNHTSCLDVSENDVQYAINVLNQCGTVYQNHNLIRECRQDDQFADCHSLPQECFNSWAYNIFHFLADKELSVFVDKEAVQNVPFLKYAMIFLPIACSTTSMAYYSAIKSLIPSSYYGIQMEAMELGLRDGLFDHHLIQDSWMLIGVAFAIGSIMWMYSGSLIMAMASVLSIPLSLGLSYSAYKYIFRLTFFPFLNLVAAVISLGIGVDDAFIFCKMWKFLKQRAALMNVKAVNDGRDGSILELQNAESFVSCAANQSGGDAAQEAVQSSEFSGTQSVGTHSCHAEVVPEASSSQSDHGADCGGGVRPSDEGDRCRRGDCPGTGVNTGGVPHCGGSIDWLVCQSLKCAFQSMFATSLTTAVAFYLSYLSKVTAIRCFSIFAGTAVITNFLLMLTWFPAAVIIAERTMVHQCSERCHCFLCPDRTPDKSLSFFSCTFLNKLCAVMKNCDKRFNMPERWKWTCIITLGLIALCSVVIASYFPGLHPPNELEFQLLHSSHLFERYHLVIRHFFSFEGDESGRDEEPGMSLRFVFGVMPLDTGDPLDPTSRVPRGQQASNLHFDAEFDMASQEAQVWFLRFCQSVRTQPFYGSNSGPLLNNCFMETFRKWMSRRCIEPIEKLDRTPCCETSSFPFTRKVFKKCLLRALTQLHKTPYLLDLHRGESAGPRFLKTKPHQMVAAVVEYESSIPFTTSFTAMNLFYNAVDTWMKEQMESAPRGLKVGWFVSNLHFYDLQFTLSTGVLSGVCISLAVSAITLLVLTCNIFKSVLTSLSIASATSVALATLSLLGWSLGPVESLTLSLAVGLSADFSIHYAVSRRRNSKGGCSYFKKRESAERAVNLCEHSCGKTTCACCKHVHNVIKLCDSGHEVDCEVQMEPFVGVPATLAAITTIIAGLLMLPSSIVAYNQVGIFLIVLIMTSWVYSTLFLLPLLALFQV